MHTGAGTHQVDPLQNSVGREAARAAAAAASFFFSALKAIPFAFEALDLARLSLIDASLAFYKSE